VRSHRGAALILCLAPVFSLLPVPGGLRAAGQDPPAMPPILSVRERKAAIDGWVTLRLERVLPEEMRRAGLDMWLVICNEGVEDPVFRALVPEDPWAVRRLSMLVFYDRGGAGVERVLIARHAKPSYVKDWNEGQETQWQALARVVAARDPKRIGINQAEKIPFGDGLTAGLKEKLVLALGPELAARLVSAEELAVRMLERRIPEEMPLYDHVVTVARAIIREGFSSRVITPGVTTAEELAWWLNQRIEDLGLERASQATVSIIRAGAADANDGVIRRGDVVHCDVCIKYLGLVTDTQELGYVLREGEGDVPAGLKDALRKGNRMQDILAGEFQTGRSGNDIQIAALEKGRREGLKPRVYTHPIGLHLHGAGAVIGVPDRQDPARQMEVEGRRGDYPMHADTAHAIELSVRATIPEWNGQEIEIGIEQEGLFDGTQVRFIGGRQTSFHVIK
jgi:hypothetical protein